MSLFASLNLIPKPKRVNDQKDFNIAIKSIRDKAVIDEIEHRVLDPELLHTLKSLPELHLDIVRVVDKSDNETNKSQLCEELQIDSNAIQPFNPEEAISIFIENDMLKNCMLYDNNTIKKLYSLMKDEKIERT